MLIDKNVWTGHLQDPMSSSQPILPEVGHSNSLGQACMLHFGETLHEGVIRERLRPKARPVDHVQAYGWHL